MSRAERCEQERSRERTENETSGQAGFALLARKRREPTSKRKSAAFLPEYIYGCAFMRICLRFSNYIRVSETRARMDNVA